MFMAIAKGLPLRLAGVHGYLIVHWSDLRTVFSAQINSITSARKESPAAELGKPASFAALAHIMKKGKKVQKG